MNRNGNHRGGGLFDFNGDGKVSFGELFLASGMFRQKGRKNTHGSVFVDTEPDDTEPDDMDSADGQDPEEAKYSWRQYCGDYEDTGVDPYEYETKEEYERTGKPLQEAEAGRDRKGYSGLYMLQCEAALF